MKRALTIGLIGATSFMARSEPVTAAVGVAAATALGAELLKKVSIQIVKDPSLLHINKQLLDTLNDVKEASDHSVVILKALPVYNYKVEKELREIGIVKKLAMFQTIYKALNRHLM